jgi:hypothetical protein
MDLNTVDSSSTAGGTLIIKWSDDGFGPTVGNAFASIGGTSGGTVKYDTYADAGNAIFGTTTPLTTQSFGAGSFSGDAGGPDLAAQGSPYSLTQVITITHTGKATTSLNAVLTVPDGGMTLMLLGSGLTALSLLRRKFAIKA